MESHEQESFFSGLAGISKLFIFILILVIVTGLFIVLTENEDTAIEENETESEEALETSSENQTETETINEVSLNISDQESGNSVYISEILLDESRWVVIHEDLEGELGNILGATLFNPEKNEGEVELLRETEKGKTYQAVLYSLGEREKDKDRVFDTERDLPLINENEEVVSVSFEIY